MTSPLRSLAVLALLAASPAAAETLVAPKALIADPGSPPQQREAVVLAARRYVTFWNTRPYGPGRLDRFPSEIRSTAVNFKPFG